MCLFPSAGQAFLTLSPLQVSSLAVISGRLWVGTGGGALFSIPLPISKFYFKMKQQVLLYGLSSINFINDHLQRRRLFPSHITPLHQPSWVTMDIDKLSGSSLLHLVRFWIQRTKCFIYLLLHGVPSVCSLRNHVTTFAPQIVWSPLLAAAPSLPLSLSSVEERATSTSGLVSWKKTTLSCQSV